MSRLLNESWIEGLPDNVVDNLESLNRYVVARICQRIKEIGDIGTSDAHRLKSAIQYAAGDLDTIEKEVARIMRINQEEVQRLFEGVAAENIDFANTYYAARGMTKLKTYADRAALASFVEAAKQQAMDGTANISNTHMIGFKRGKRVVPLREYYITSIDRAITFVKLGTVDYSTAMRSTVRDMARSGLRRVAFEPKTPGRPGYSRRLDSQARMNILEGVRRLNAEMMAETGREFGADGVEISAHALCAPDHQSIQGRQYGNRDYEQLNESLQRPIGTLNCHHFATPIIMGVSKPIHSEKELAELIARSNAPVEYKGHTMTRYEASQKQRQMETAIRYVKDERDACVAAGDKIGATQARKRSAALSREYKSFCEKAGLTPRPERTRSMTGPTAEKVKSVAKKQGSAILKSTGDGDIPITDAAIQRVPKIKINGWDEERSLKLREAHKELLRFAKDAPVGTEAGAIYNEDMKLIDRKMGEYGCIRLKKVSIPYVMIHNHPNGLTFSAEDIKTFIKSPDMMVLTAVGNNGIVYAIQKTDDYMAADFLKAFIPILLLYDEAEIEQERAIVIERFLKGVERYGVKFITGG